MNSWLLASLALITFANRYAFFSEIIRYTPGPRIRRFLSYSTYAVLTAIWTPIVFHFEPPAAVSSAGLDYLLGAALAAILTVAEVRSILVVLISTGTFFVLRFFLLQT